MRLLSIETSSARGSLALAEGGENKPAFVDEISWVKQSSHSESISVCLQALLEKSKWQLTDLTHIAVGIGPGSFTGIRVGLNFAKALAYGLNLPVAGINSLKILSAPKPKAQVPVLVLINAYRNQIFIAAYQNEQEALSPRVIPLAELETMVSAPYFCRGDGYELAKESLAKETLELLQRENPPHDFPTAQDLAHLMIRDQSPNAFSDWGSVKPLYIRNSSAEEKLKEGRLKPLLKI